MRRQKTKRARPDLEWPWCDACDAHVREVNGERHECTSSTATSSLETRTAWEQPSLFGGGL